MRYAGKAATSEKRSVSQNGSLLSPISVTDDIANDIRNYQSDFALSLLACGIYLNMRVLGVIHHAIGRTRHQRIQNVAATTIVDQKRNHPNSPGAPSEPGFAVTKTRALSGCNTKHAKT